MRRHGCMMEVHGPAVRDMNINIKRGFIKFFHFALLDCWR